MSRKKKKWAITTSPGPHSSEESLPLLASLRESLGIARNKKEAKDILTQGEVKVDGRVRRKLDYPIGLMDVLEIPKTGEAWRVLRDKKGYFHFHKIDEEELGFKLTKVTEKSQFKGGKLQISLHDGKTIVGEFEDIEIGDTLKISLPDLDFQDHFSLEKGNLALITGGSNVGEKGKIKDITEVESSSPNQFVIETEDREFQSPEDYVFVIGEKESEISLPNGD